LIDKLNIRRDISRNPLFDTMFVMQNMDLNELKIGGLNIRPYNLENKVSKFDLILFSMEGKDGLNFIFEYCSKLFKRETIERMRDHFIQIMREVVDNPDKKICEIEMITDEEKSRILYEFNDTNAGYPNDRTIHQLFEEQVERIPDNVALVYEDRRMTYRELNEKSNQLAGYLRDKGVKADSIVGIMVNRSFEMIVGIMGILKAGGAYLPIDPEYPEDRINFMLEDSRAKLLLTQGSLKGSLGINVEIINLNNDGIYKGKELNLEQINKAKDLAYVTYTTCSSARTKGVMFEHRSINNFIYGIIESIEYIEGKTILGISLISDIILGLLKGLEIVIANESEIINSKQLSELIIDKKIDIIQISSHKIQMMKKDLGTYNFLSKVKMLIIEGEDFPGNLFDDLNDIYTGKIFCMYSQKEKMICFLIKEINNHDEKYILDKPAENMQIYILDKYNKIQPYGLEGEMYIGGYGLARGYLKRIDLENEDFKQNPFIIDERIYRTGILARRLTDGNVMITGQMPYIAAINGHKVKLNDIKDALLEHQLINDALVVNYCDSKRNNYLSAYIVSDGIISKQLLRKFLLNYFPEFMIPSFYIYINEIPLAQDGGIIWEKLPYPDNFIIDNNGFIKIKDKNNESTLVDISNTKKDEGDFIF
jgi:amino acid adenylation domain-containing protein